MDSLHLPKEKALLGRAEAHGLLLGVEETPCVEEGFPAVLFVECGG